MLLVTHSIIGYNSNRLAEINQLMKLCILNIDFDQVRKQEDFYKLQGDAIPS